MSEQDGSEMNSNSKNKNSNQNRGIEPVLTIDEKMINYVALMKTKNVEALRERCRIHFLEPGKKTKVELIAVLETNYRELLGHRAAKAAQAAAAAAAEQKRGGNDKDENDDEPVRDLDNTNKRPLPPVNDKGNPPKKKQKRNRV